MDIDKNQVKKLVPIERVIREELGEPAKTVGGRPFWFCVFHDDKRTPNLTAHENGFRCFACGAAGDVIDFAIKRHGLGFGDGLRWLAERYAPHLLSGANDNGSDSGGRRAVATYEYRDEKEELLFEVLRYEPKYFRQRRPDGKGGWVWSLEGVRRVLYRLPEILLSSGIVFLVEGEKDVETLRALGQTATCNPHGAGKWREEYNERLRGRGVVIFADNDDVGRKDAEQKAQALYGIAATIKVVHFHGLPEHGDVSDYLQTHSNKELDALVEATPFWMSKVETDTDFLSKLTAWGTIQSMEIKYEWLLHNLIPKQSLTVLYGRGGIGKSFLAMAIARAVATGERFLGLDTIKTPVIYCDYENPDVVLAERAKLMGSGDGVFFWRGSNQEVPLPRLDETGWEALRKTPKNGLLILDTLRASFRGDENCSSDMSFVMARLKQLRDEGRTVLCLHHSPKNSERGFRGSSAIADSCDHLLNLAPVKLTKAGEELPLEDFEGDEDVVYRLGVIQKTRYIPHRVHITLDPGRGFILAPSPDQGDLNKMKQVLYERGDMLKSAFVEECKRCGISEKRARRLVDVGKGSLWNVIPTGAKNGFRVSLIQFGSLAGVYMPPNCRTEIEELEARAIEI